MNPVNPVCQKIASFFEFGAVSGQKLEKVIEQTDVAKSYDTQSTQALALNCIYQVHGIKNSLFDKAANSGLSIVSEETVGSGGIIDEVLKRREQDIQIFEKTIGLINRVSIESATLRNIISIDEIFRQNLQEKVHKSALFVFDLTADISDIGALNIGCKETRRAGVSSDRIICVIIPEQYRDMVKENYEFFKIPIDKVIFVGDKEESISISYMDSEGGVPSCKLAKPINVPDYESVLNELVLERGNLQKNPLFTHMTRLPG